MPNTPRDAPEVRLRSNARAPRRKACCISRLWRADLVAVTRSATNLCSDCSPRPSVLERKVVAHRHAASCSETTGDSRIKIAAESGWRSSHTASSSTHSQPGGDSRSLGPRMQNLLRSIAPLGCLIGMPLMMIVMGRNSRKRDTEPTNNTTGAPQPEITELRTEIDRLRAEIATQPRIHQ